jgi:DNA-directed RNA polymerase subunit RPC12/RpoP
MQITPGLVAAAVGMAVVVAGLWFRHARTRRTRNVGRPVTHGPANLRYTCVGCSQEFTHSRKTLAAWEQGARRFHCKACHTKQRGLRPVRRKNKP